jgi:hypothetical protein
MTRRRATLLTCPIRVVATMLVAGRWLDRVAGSMPDHPALAGLRLHVITGDDP